MILYSIIQRFLWAAAFSIVLSNSFAQLPDYHLQVFDYASGIRTGTILSVVKDQKGFLWILYPRSVQRFDGRHAISFRTNGDMSNIHCDEEGRVWAGSSRKVYLFDDETQHFSEVTIKTNDSNVNTGPIFSMPGKKTWLLANSGFYEYDAAKNHFHPVLKNLPVPPPYNFRSFGNAGATLFFGHARKVYRYNINTQKLDSLPDKNMRRIFPVSENMVLLNTWDIRSYWYNFLDGGITEAQPPSSMRKNRNKGKAFAVRGMAHSGNGKILLPTSEGLFEYELGQNKYRHLILYSNGNAVNTDDFANNIYADNDGYVWLTTIDGVARFSLQAKLFGLIRIRQLDSELPVGIDNIRGITEDSDGNLWLATGSGIAKWMRKTGQWQVILPDDERRDWLAYPSVRGITYDGRYIILGPANKGMWLFDPVAKRFRRPRYASKEVQRASESDFVDAITTLRGNRHLVMGRDALYVIEGKDYTLRFVDVPAAKENTNFAYQDNDGNVWLTTMTGLHLLDSNLHYVGQARLPASRSFISAGFMLQDNRFLFAMESGLFTASYLGRSIQVEKFTHLFDSIFVTSIFRDDGGVFWATSENGIYRFDPSRSQLNLFDHSDNVQGFGFNSNSWCKTRDGLLFMGGINGLNYFDPNAFSPKSDSLQVFIQRVKNGINDSLSYSLRRTLVLPYSQRSLEAEFAAPYFNNPDKVKYRYKLEGFDEEWKYLGSGSTVRFSSLPAGDYSLLVQASVNNADWIAAANHFSFRIQKPFWLQYWFLATTAFVVALSLWLFIRARNRKRAEKEETRKRMADVEMQALRAQMNPHFIFNCLNSINRYIVKSDQATASLYLTRFAKLIRLILDNSNSKSVTLTNELESLRLYIEMESIRFERQFTYSMQVDQEVHPDGVYVPPLIIQPYVENAIWHGLLHKERAGHLSIVVCGNHESLECIVEDNGVGRQRARELKSKSASTKKSLGMKLTEDRLALLGKSSSLRASVEVTDLVDADGDPCGTRVVLRIPLDK
ncbi:MAG TPA: histidine kinase [Chitinophagaceae bacterium]